MTRCIKGELSAQWKVSYWHIISQFIVGLGTNTVLGSLVGFVGGEGLRDKGRSLRRLGLVQMGFLGHYGGSQ